uniref:BTB domain-containing protein n=1 Tax=Panagrolaimus superbus TaxID=310955 RepID=A0A914XVA5_9BILA
MPRHNRNHFDDDEDEEDYYGDEDYYDDDSEPEDETANEDSEPENETAMIQRNICVLQLQKFDLFESQNKETGHFDVTFEIDKKFLHAHKFALAAASKTFQTQFSKRWTEKVNDDEPIKIQNYSYEEFLQLLCFLYSGVCKLTSDNVFSLTDMGEFYDLPLLKEYCDKFMSKLKNDVDIDNVYDKVDFALRYSLSDYLNSIKKFIRQNFESLAKSEQFMIFKKPFVQVMMSVERSFDEEKLLESVYKWAVHQATLKKDAQNSDEFNMAVAIKNELYGIISDVKFAEINLEFVLQFVADKELIFSTSELYTMFYLSFHENREELLFKALYGLAEKEAKAKIACSHNRINLNDLIKAEASKFLSEVNFGGMSFEFIMNFVAKKSFLFTPSELYKIVSNCKRRQDQEAELFKSLVKLAEDQEIEKQKEAMKDNFLLSEAVKNALSENLSSIKFQLMPYKFLFDFVVEKGFFLGPFDISGFAFKSIADSENKEDAFKNVYYLSEKQALRKHKDAIANFPNFKLIDAVKLEMLQAFHLFKFSEMDVEFLKDFIVDKGFIIFPKELRAFFMNSRARYGNEEKAFKAVSVTLFI